MKLTASIFILLLTSYIYSQPNNFKYNYDVQLLLSEGYSTFGCIGVSGELNLNIDRKKIMLSPYVAYGSYTSTYTTDVREIRFTESTTGINIFYKLIRYEYFEAKTGTGIALSYLNGFKDEWNGWYGEVHLPEEDINEISVGMQLIAGVKIGNKFSLEILPIYFSVGLSDKKYTPKIGISYAF